MSTQWPQASIQRSKACHREHCRYHPCVPKFHCWAVAAAVNMSPESSTHCVSRHDVQAPDKGAVNERPPQVTLQKGTLGLYGYRGPRPIPGHGPHTYVFQLFALKEPLTLKSPAGYTVFVNQLKGNVLAWGRLDGTYEQF